TRTAASTSRCARTSASSTSWTRRPRPSTRSCASTCRRTSTSRSSSEAGEDFTMTTLPPTERATTAVLGTKLGMTQVWDDAGRLVPVTVVSVGTNVVTQVRTPEVDGYNAVQLAYGQIDPRKVSQPLKGHFEKAGVTPRRHLVEIRTADAGAYQPGQELTAEVFEAGAKVDVIGTTK